MHGGLYIILADSPQKTNSSISIYATQLHPWRVVHRPSQLSLGGRLTLKHLRQRHVWPISKSDSSPNTDWFLMVDRVMTKLGNKPGGTSCLWHVWCQRCISTHLYHVRSRHDHTYIDACPSRANVIRTCVKCCWETLHINRGELHATPQVHG